MIIARWITEPKPSDLAGGVKIERSFSSGGGPGRTREQLAGVARA